MSGATTLDPETAQAVAKLHEAAAHGVLRVIARLHADGRDRQPGDPGDERRRFRIAYQAWRDVALTFVADLGEMAAAVAGTIDESLLIEPARLPPDRSPLAAWTPRAGNQPADRATVGSNVDLLERCGRDIELILVELCRSVGPALDDWAGAAAHHYRGLARNLRDSQADLDAIVAGLIVGPATVAPPSAPIRGRSMSVSSSVVDAPPTGPDLVHYLAANGSAFGAQLAPVLSLSLRDYLRSLIPAPQPTYNHHRYRLAQAVERYLHAHGDHDVDTVCDQLLRVPVMQQADHATLLLDAEAFLNNYLYHLAAVEARIPVALTMQSTIVSCVSRLSPPLGPTFLRTRAAQFSVLAISRNRLKQSSFCCLPTPVTMSFDIIDGEHNVADDPVLGPLVGRQLPSATAGYRQVNNEIWASLPLDHTIRRVALDDTVNAECLALHLSDEDSPVYRLLFDPPVRQAFLRTKRRLVADPTNLAVNRAAPDFLWLSNGKQLRPVGYHHGRWIIETSGADLPFPVEPATVIHLLRTGQLYPDRILTYLIRCLLPGVIAIGGTSQQDYVALYCRILAETHADTPFLESDLLTQLQPATLSRIGGRPLVEPYGHQWDQIRNLGPRTDLTTLAAAYLDQPLTRTIGRLRCVGHLVRRIQSIASGDEGTEPARFTIRG